MRLVKDDGGRSRYFKGDAGDCATRAIAIAGRLDYREVYDELAALNKAEGKAKSARDGVSRKALRRWFEGHGWEWTATMGIGTGCRVHMRAEELPKGRIVCNLSGHVAAVVDGVLHDTHDCTRGGTRCVYGYWTAPGMDSDEFRARVDSLRDDLLAGLITPAEYGDGCARAAAMLG